MADSLDHTEEIEYGMSLDEVEYENSEDELNNEYEPRLKNKGKIQRVKITGFDQRQPMAVYGQRDDTIHGHDAKKTPYTLIVFRWHLHQRELGKRFKSLRICIVFTSARKDGASRDVWYDPNVKRVSPNGTYSLMPSMMSSTAKKSIEGSLGAGFAGADASLKLGYELSQTYETEHRITINGSEYSDTRGAEQGDPDRCNAVEWNLFENEASRSGLPTFFRTAVLLERRRGDMERFNAAFTLRAQVDSVTDTMAKVKKLFGVIPRDDPVIFDPRAPEEISPYNEYVNKLDEVPLEDVCKYVMYKALPGQEAAAQGKAKSDGAVLEHAVGN